jgi:hypothetical protein
MAQDCSEIRFAKGAISGSVSAKVKEGASRCYSFATGSGQSAHLKLTGSQNACFTIMDVADCQQSFSFTTREKLYKVEIFQLMPAPSAEKVVLTLSIR